MWVSFVVLLLGFVLLSFAADGLVVGASALAKRLNVSDLVIGLTVVAFGTSAPELVVNLVASFNGTSEIALTNILGSNAINTFIILGLSAVVFPIVAKKSTIRFEVPLSIMAAVAVFLLALDHVISRIDGLVLLAVFALFVLYSVRMGMLGSADEETGTHKSLRLSTAILYIIAGLAGLVVGGEAIVRSAVRIATDWGVSQSVVGVTIVALGTSLPELATSVAAALKKNTDLAIGNVIGSNIFNVFFVLGISASIRPLPSYHNLPVDALMAALGSFLVLLFILFGRKHKITRLQGALLLVVYGVYLTWLLLTL